MNGFISNWYHREVVYYSRQKDKNLLLSGKIRVFICEPPDPILELKKYERFRRNIRIIAGWFGKGKIYEKKEDESDIISV